MIDCEICEDIISDLAKELGGPCSVMLSRTG